MPQVRRRYAVGAGRGMQATVTSVTTTKEHLMAKKTKGGKGKGKGC